MVNVFKKKSEKTSKRLEFLSVIVLINENSIKMYPNVKTSRK